MKIVYILLILGVALCLGFWVGLAMTRSVYEQKMKEIREHVSGVKVLLASMTQERETAHRNVMASLDHLEKLVTQSPPPEAQPRRASS
jgi:hypothetical protein